MKGRARLLSCDRVERDLGPLSPVARRAPFVFFFPLPPFRRMPLAEGDSSSASGCSLQPFLEPSRARSQTHALELDAKIADLKLPRQHGHVSSTTACPPTPGTASHLSAHDSADDHQAASATPGDDAKPSSPRTTPPVVCTDKKRSGNRHKKRHWPRRLAVLLVAAIVCTVAMVAHHGDSKALDMNDIVAEAIAAHDEAEELAARGETWRAVSALEQVSARLTKIERAARYVSADKGDEVQLYEEAQLAWGHARATMGSLLLEQAAANTTTTTMAAAGGGPAATIDARTRHWLAGRAVQALQPTCPTLWYLSRRTNPGDDHVRGEIGWARCYADLIAAHRFRGEDRLAAAIERDVVKHSTPWFRRRRDSKHLLPANHSKSARRHHELHLRWPIEPNKLRFSKSFSRPPRSASRAQRNARRARAIFALSRLAALSPAERAITARDFGRAKAKARALRRDLDDLVAKFFEVYADTLQRARLLGKLRDVATDAVRHLDDDEQQQHHHRDFTDTSSSTTPPADADDQMARWNAGVALAAMLRASQQTGTDNETTPEREPTWTSGDTQGALEDALDALVSSEHPTADSEPPEAPGAAAATTSKRFGRAFARHVANEASDYVAVAVGAHHHGWAWLHAELSRLDEVQRRLALAITPLAGPPPGFVGRYELLHAWIARRDRSFYESHPSSSAEQHAARQQPTDKPRHAKQSSSHEARRVVEDDLTTVRSASLAAFCVVALSAAHGTALLREQQRKENDGYAKRRPKRTMTESLRALLAHFCLALCVCALSCWTRLKNAMLPVKDDLVQLLAAARGVLDARCGRPSCAPPRRPATDGAPSQQRAPPVPATAVAVKKDGPARTAARARLTTRSHEVSRVTPRASPQREDENGKQLDEVAINKSSVIASKEDDDNNTSDEGEWRDKQDAEDDEWKPVPKGGRIVHEGPRILATATKAEIGVRDQAAVALNVGVSAVPVAKNGASPQQQLQTARSSEECDKIAKQATKQPHHPSVVSKAARAAPQAHKGSEPAPKITNHRKQSQAPHTAANGHSHKGQSSKTSEWKRKSRSSTKQHVAAPGNSWIAYTALPVVDTAGYTVNQRAPSPVSVSSDLGGRSLEDAIRYQVEYYFSVSNLCKDVYLRTHCMDSKGYVTLAHICSFKRVRALTDDAAVVRDALFASTKLELVDAAQPQLCKVRTVDQPERWATRMAPSKQSSGAGDSSSSDNSEDDDDSAAVACNEMRERANVAARIDN